MNIKKASTRPAINVFVGVALYALASLAAAAGLDGPYIGANVGWSWAKADTSRSLEGATCGNPATCRIQANAVSSVPGMNLNGFTGGAQAGYNWSSGKLVYGFEFDINHLALNRSSTSVVTAATAAPKFITSMDSIDSSLVATIRPRIGFMATDQALVFVTGGLALGGPKVGNQTTIFSTGIGATSGTYNLPASKQIATGWVVGGGVEYALSKNMSVKGEYQYVKFDNPTVRGGNTTFAGTDLDSSTISISSSVKSNILRVGLNWKF